LDSFKIFTIIKKAQNHYLKIEKCNTGVLKSELNTLMKQLYTFLLLLITTLSFGQLRYTETIFPQADTLKNVKFAVADCLNSKLSLAAGYEIHDGESTTESCSLYMDIFTPNGDSVVKRPAILFAFSSGFITGSRHNQDMVAFCDSFARRGYVTATFDYRLGIGSDVDRILNVPYHLSISDKNVTRSVYRGVQDSRAAIRYLKHNAENYGIDTTHIFLIGSSAGGIISLHNIYLDKLDEIPSYIFEEPTLGNLDTIGVQGYDGRANAIVSLWGALQTPEHIEDEQTPTLLIHGEEDDIVYFKKGMPLKSLVPETSVIDYSVSETFGSYCIDTALINRNIPHETYFVPERGHEFYGVDTGEFMDDGPNQYWDTVNWRISDFFFDLIKPEANFEAYNIHTEVNCTNLSSTDYYLNWDFGDGTNSNELNPVHVYNEDGYKTIKLTTCNQNMACDTISQVIYLNPVSVSDISINQLKIYPNPADNRLQIEGISEVYSYEIYDMLGRMHMADNNKNNNTFIISKLKPGLYILKIRNSSNTVSFKFQKIE